MEFACSERGTIRVAECNEAAHERLLRKSPDSKRPCHSTSDQRIEIANGLRGIRLCPALDPFDGEAAKHFVQSIRVEGFREVVVPTGREEALRVAKMLEEASVDAIEFSGGTGRSGNLMPPRPGALKTREEEVYYRESARLYKQQVGIPLILVGGIRSLETAEDLVGSGVADYIALSRPLVSEPDLVGRWREGERSKARCVSCNGCFGPAFDGRGAYCTALEGK